MDPALELRRLALLHVRQRLESTRVPTLEGHWAGFARDAYRARLAQLECTAAEVVDSVSRALAEVERELALAGGDGGR